MKNNKIPVGVLGATGSVGQKFIQLLSQHPYFFIQEVAASERSAGKKYKEAVNWILSTDMPAEVASLEVKNCEPDINCKVVFSGLDSSIAGEVEEEFAKQGYVHYHELVRTDNGEKHPELVAWIKHVAVPAGFILDKGAMPEDKHIVAAGIDYRFLNNYFIPYDPKGAHGHYE